MIARIVGDREIDLCGIDLSVAAVRRAVRTVPAATWIVANADRRLPLATGSVDLALSLFGRRNGPEVRRVLRPHGRLVVAIPGGDDLIELRGAVQGTGLVVERVPVVVDALTSDFALAGQRTVRWGATLDAARIEDALALTYRGARHRERERAARLTSLEVTLSAELLDFRPRRR